MFTGGYGREVCMFGCREDRGGMFEAGYYWWVWEEECWVSGLF